MIIFGTRGVKSTIQKGEFSCPQCNVSKPYKFKKVRLFFTLYFIPIIPIRKLGEYVECQTCKGTFIPKVLEYQQSQTSDAFLSEYEKAMKHSMVLIMLADGEIHEDEMVAVLNIVNKFSHHDITRAELEDYVRQVQSNPEDISTYLKGMAPTLNDHGKELIIKCAISVAVSDGNFDESEMAFIQEMAQVLAMPKEHFQRIFNEMFEESHTS